MAEIHLTLNNEAVTWRVQPNETLLSALRRQPLYSVKHGCETGECGACVVLIEGKPTPTCITLAAAAAGKRITTLESFGVKGSEMTPLHEAFVETGAIQCGYCTPAQILCAHALLQENRTPNEGEVREAIAGVLCRCTGYVKPVQAILRAAATMRGESVPPVNDEVDVDRVFSAPPGLFTPRAGDIPSGEGFEGGGDLQTRIKPIVVAPAEGKPTSIVGKPEPKVDGVKLAMGRPVFTDDVEMRGMLYGALLTSPHAHARITHIETSKAKAIPGVHAVLTYKDVRRVIYASGGQSYPNPPPYDQVSLDHKVRHVGDRVAVVAAESPELCQQALDAIEVEWEVLPAVFDPEESFRVGAPLIHDEPDAIGIKDAARNLVCQVHAVVGDEPSAWAAADYILEGEYRVHQVQQSSIEPHICITYWDEDERLVIRTSTQVPFHVRRMVAPLIGLPVARIRVIKPRIGGGFGGKQEMLIEDLCAHLTLATGRPVRFEYSRAQEFTSARSRHPQILRYKSGVTKDGLLTGQELYILGNTGAYGTHGLTVQTVSGLRGLSTYKAPYLKFECDVVYTNIPTPGAYRGYGAPQSLFALEIHMEQIAERLGMDVLEFKAKNWVRVGDPLLLAQALGEGREGFAQTVLTSALAECVNLGAKAIDWHAKRRNPGEGAIKRGVGMAVCMHGTAIAGLDMGAASIKMNDDGSFNVLVGATDLGTGSDTVIAQIVAETLGVPLSKVIMYSSDTDMTPFDTGAYASSTTYISGGAAMRAAEQVRGQIQKVAAKMLNAADPESLWLADERVYAPGGSSVTLEQVALRSLHQDEQHQIMGTASHMSYASPPPFAAQFVEVEVDTRTGQVTVTQLVFAVDCGIAINPITAAGQVEGGMTQALGYGHCEEMIYDGKGVPLATRFGDYHVYQADEMPDTRVIFVETYEPTGPYGAKAVAEIPKDGVAPALASAIRDAVGVWIHDIPFTPEKVWRAINGTR
ncbi:MAG: molybdopterin-dependent oxidoreductase [Anaerolineales bacterium]|nr:molybdopterin-dependent oxidoreductase [Anaerolineales bacterium]